MQEPELSSVQIGRNGLAERLPESHWTASREVSTTKSHLCWCIFSSSRARRAKQPC